MNILVLFSGTGSIEKVFDKQHDIRGLDLDNHFKPYYNVDILTWKYQNILKEWIPDYIHASPVCKEFSSLKSNKDRDLDLGLNLLNKCLEIIEFVKTINNKLKYTIENPKGLMRKQECMKKYNLISTSYCMYGYPYMKPTDFWYGGFELELRKPCRRTKDQKNWCWSMKENNGKHKVIIGYNEDGRMVDWKYFTILRKTDEYKNKVYSDTYFRYRIPHKLCEDIRDSILCCS